MFFDELILACIKGISGYNPNIETPDSFIERFLKGVIKYIYFNIFNFIIFILIINLIIICLTKNILKIYKYYSQKMNSPII